MSAITPCWSGLPKRPAWMEGRRGALLSGNADAEETKAEIAGMSRMGVTRRALLHFRQFLRAQRRPAG